MKKLTFYLILALLISNLSVAQRDDHEKIESAKIAFYSQKLELTPEEAQEFWPVYNEFNQKKKDLKIEMRIARLEMGKSSISDAEAKKMISAQFEAKQKELDLSKSYFLKFQEIIPPKKVMKLAQAEREFHERIMKRIQQERHQRKPMGGN